MSTWQQTETLSLPHKAMYRTIICSVGTSLLTNRDERPWSGWQPGNPLPPHDEVLAWLRQADLTRASAETNTLRAMEIDEGDELVLFGSLTDEGRFCTRVLWDFYTSRKVTTGVQTIAGLGYSADRFTAGLKSLVNEAIRAIKKARDQRQIPILCATGGFKAEIAFLNLVGALLGAEVVYMHELHRELVRLPQLPLTWDTDFVTAHQHFFEWIDDVPRPSHEVESRLKATPALRTLVEEAEDGNTYLSAAGELLFKAAKAREGTEPPTWPPNSARLPEDKDEVSKVAHHRPAGWEKVVQRLCALACVEQVRYDNQARSHRKVQILDEASGVLGVRFGDDPPLPLRVETTAKGREQCTLVAEYIRRNIVR
jgi:putative CRISPR-associated protein (TIGR02619 family)